MTREPGLQPEPKPDHLERVAALCLDALEPATELDWSVPARDLEWSCRRTLDHLPDVMLFYATHLASRATSRQPSTRDGNPHHTVPELLDLSAAAAHVLADVARATPVDARGFHPAGMADASGFIAMACTEWLVHTSDILTGLGCDFGPAPDLVDPVLARIFPWAPTDIPDRWAVFRYETGRAPLGDRPRRDANWYWHCAPLSEWDGTVKRRTKPPGWM
jgi:hypothetical protein